MKIKRALLAMLILFGGVAASKAASAQALPNTVGSAIAEGIKSTLVRRGFAANDPRILATVEQVGARVIPLVGATGAGATWLSVLGRLNPWIASGLLIYEGIKWITNKDGSVTMQVAPPPPNSYGGIVKGGAYWVSGGYIGSDPYAVGFQAVTPTNADGGWTVWTFNENTTSGSESRKAYSYTMHHANYCPSGGCQAATVYVDFQASGAPVTCPGGSYARNGACSPYTFGSKNPSGVTTKTLPSIEQAYESLPQTAKSAAMAPELAAEAANRLWRDAAMQPNFKGEPWLASDPVTAPDLSPIATNKPNSWPRTSAINTPVPTSTNPIALPGQQSPGSGNGGDGTPSTEATDICALHPDSSACAPLGSASEVDVSRKEQSVAISPRSIGLMSGSCPEPYQVSVMGADLSFSYEPICTVAIKLRPLVLILCALAAALIFCTGLKS
ncbi:MULTISPECIES: virulence factor TspB C-terminal domain-related protein [Burkholderia]|uniref:virulence factor TspB C-terminal domain-related protein n=1 Tax=Burkholderia TaxID=32008 RepID=UPI000A487C2B|nr:MULTISPECIES: virulence factor TspB C-terminal domain-related protein [Burkholderia]